MRDDQREMVGLRDGQRDLAGMNDDLNKRRLEGIRVSKNCCFIWASSKFGELLTEHVNYAHEKYTHKSMSNQL